MNQSHKEWKVGLFVLIGLALLVVMTIQFAKGWTFLTSTYQIKLITSHVGGITEKASILMAGVQVGTVENIELNPSGKTVTIYADINGKYDIYEDAVFKIEQSGFLGDQYISVLPQENKGAVLKDGDEIECLPPFNLQEAARSATQLIQELNTATHRINQSVKRLDEILFSETTLTNIQNTVFHIESVSRHADSTLAELNSIIKTNRTPLRRTITNWVAFSKNLNDASEQINTLINTNQASISETLESLRSASSDIRNLTAGINAGKGLLGSLVKQEGLRTNFTVLTSNLVTLSSNLNAHGLLWKPEQPRPKLKTPLYTGKNPFD
ncbi:MAG: MlaD family protein [Verrucomicrobia bacterium]|nr:MlaD family protein [Verrucomicrobiota bacterium]MCF7709136.1 MlaD family protein [Verrucomicrobiota bacterium]